MDWKIKMKTTDAGPNGVKIAGGTYTIDETEAQELIDGGFATLVEKLEKSETQDEDKDSNIPELNHIGGGYYLLPNGEKVHGKEKALEALNALKAGGASGTGE